MFLKIPYTTPFSLFLPTLESKMPIDYWERRKICTFVQCHHLFNADLSLLPLVHPCALLFQVWHRRTNRQLLIYWFIIFFSKWINNSKPWGRNARSTSLEMMKRRRKREVYVEELQGPQTMLFFFLLLLLFFLIPFLERNWAPSREVNGCKRMF